MRAALRPRPWPRPLGAALLVRPHRSFGVFRGRGTWSEGDIPQEVMDLKTTKDFIAYARGRGAAVKFTQNGHIKVSHNGEQDIFSGYGRTAQLSGAKRTGNIEFLLRAGQ